MTYFLPTGKNGRLIGNNLQITVPEGNKFPLEHFATQFKIGLTNIIEANPGIDVYLPSEKTNIIIPHQLILPDTLYEGIVINSAEMRLYFYPKGKNIVVVLPIGIGEIGKNTPYDWITSVIHKKKNPSWKPTKSIRAEYAAQKKILPDVFPAGPNNPMGLYALYIGRFYAIHGTNANFGIGLRVSHGCVRLRSDDIKYLFDHVPIGTRVQFINEPVKYSIELDGTCYIEVHEPLSTSMEEFNSDQPIPIKLSNKISWILKDPNINQSIVNLALKNRSGIPVNISDKKANNGVISAADRKK